MRDRPATGGTFIRDPATGDLTPAVEGAPIAPAAATSAATEPETPAAEPEPAPRKKGR
ncbi:hypothetical protein [Ruixingdingia sedimenti]|uniref:Uncharacterized protein n=1 Tax=Ruixingdingia sedimenti TaxID=3073604 RepID=A0ABU1FET3_9RHOB|nr:hypothetical protein [Xinfangfangia sp. LG-4]MDR5655407.1 hypothetical protein [Xinfangfangia sp. LG-4]